MSQFEQKPKQWALFPMSDEDIRKKEDFYHEKGWDLDKVPTYSGKLTLPDGIIVRIEGRMVDGTNGRGDFFVGSCYVPENQGGGGGSRRDDRRDDRRSPRDDRSRDRDDRRSSERNSRDDRSRDRGYDDRRSNRSFDADLDDDVPF